jgi:hypothetical protein
MLDVTRPTPARGPARSPSWAVLLLLGAQGCNDAGNSKRCASNADCGQQECVAEMCAPRTTRAWGTIPNRTVADFKKEQLAVVANHRVFFGHQSVGGNILDGFRDLSKVTGVPIEPIEWQPGFDFSQAGRTGLVHALNGQNEDPVSKIDAFAKTIESGVGDHAEVAFFKFCYIDFKADTDVDQVFERYQSTMSRLKASYPKTTFAHMTVPLTVTQRGVTGTVKRLLGKGAWGESENWVRERFNRKLRATYEGKEPLFDLALLEATDPNGGLASFTWEGQSVPRLVDGYAYDGQHLNETGRRYVAARLSTFLAALLER